MTALPKPVGYSTPCKESLSDRAAMLDGDYTAIDAGDVVERAIRRDFAGRIAVVSSFGADSAVLLDLVAQVDPTTPVIFLDTGKLFWETRNYRDILVARLGLTDVRSVEPSWYHLAKYDPDGTLHRSDPDLCCQIRKVLPLDDALAGFDAWITGRKRFQGFDRDRLTMVEVEEGRFKINPLAGSSRVEITARFVERDLPYHPLVGHGYASIGCQPCTGRVQDGDPARSGRWAGSAKTECGIHCARWFEPAEDIV
ncbi:MAG: phosphoadenylyl-sulfate reductase [Alphaproteobacteria bacterium]|nr:phosphoadenylyl-sulfate reductase [Alphaproteobacteria bacterium]